MSVIQPNSDVGLTNLSTDFKRAGNSSSTNNVTADIAQKNVKAEQSTTAIEQTKNGSNVENNNAPTGTPLDSKQLEKVAQQLQDFVGDLNRNLQFSVDKDSGRDVIKVFDKDSGDLLKQYPSEEVLTLVSKLSEMVGGFIDAEV